MAKAKAKSKRKRIPPLKHTYHYTLDELQWGERMLHYVANNLETDYNQAAQLHTRLLTKQDVPDLFQAFFKWVSALVKQYPLKDAMEIFTRRYRDCMNNRDAFNESNGEMLRLAFHNTFPGKTVSDVTHFLQYCLDASIGDANLATIYFDAYSDEEAFDMITQAFFDQDENSPADQHWHPTGLRFVNRTGNHVDITRQFFDQVDGLIEDPRPILIRKMAPVSDTTNPFVPADRAIQTVKDVNTAINQSLSSDDDDSHEALAQQIIDICNALKDDIDSGDLGELAKELNLD